MKKYTIIIMYMLFVLLGGCGRQTTGWQTGDVTLVRAMGVDVLPEATVRLSAFGEDESLSAEGASIAESVMRLRAAGTGFVHLGHTEQLLLGEAFAQEGIHPLLEFVARDRQIGPGARLWVVRGGMAHGAAGRENVANRLMRLAQEWGGASPTVDCTVTGMMRALARGGSVAVPALVWQQEEPVPGGYAVLRQGRLVGFLDGDRALGLELLCGRGGGQPVELLLADGTSLSLSVGHAAISCEPTLTDNGVQSLRLRCVAGLEVLQSAALTDRQREAAQQEAELILCDRVASALACAQIWDADFVGLEGLARTACSKDEWDDVERNIGFRSLPLHVTAEVRVRWPADIMEGYGDE